MSLLLEQGNRGLLVGKTGSGKSQNAIFQLRHAVGSPVIIFDTKIEDCFFSLPEGDEELEVVNNFDEFKALAKRAAKDWPDYILVRPSADEVRFWEPLDNYTHFVYNNFGKCFIYFDEMLQWHKNMQAGSGLINLLTRGRSRGKTTLMASQRPAWISRFCFTESDKFYVHKLNDQRDYQSLSAVVPNIESVARPPRFHFWHYDTGADMESPVLFKPVPFTPVDNTKIFSRKWL